MSREVADYWMPKIVFVNGKPVKATPHEATFNGRHNACKAKVLLVLYHRKHKLNQTDGLSLAELCAVSGVGYNYMGSRVGKWVAWDYLVRKIKQGMNRPVYSYSIAKRGEHFIEDRIPRERLKDYLEEIRASRVKS